MKTLCKGRRPTRAKRWMADTTPRTMSAIMGPWSLHFNFSTTAWLTIWVAQRGR